MSLGQFVPFDYLAKKIKINFFEEWMGVINEKPNRGVRERKKVGIL
jgi:hypothetical protein